jgi:hypothetical protein
MEINQRERIFSKSAKHAQKGTKKQLDPKLVSDYNMFYRHHKKTVKGVFGDLGHD